MVGDCGTHAALDVDLGHRETVIRQSLHEGTIELEQILATAIIHGQSYPGELERPQKRINAETTDRMLPSWASAALDPRYR